MNSKKQKVYVRPTVEVVQLKMRNQLLAGSGRLKDYKKNDYTEE